METSLIHFRVQRQWTLWANLKKKNKRAYEIKILNAYLLHSVCPNVSKYGPLLALFVKVVIMVMY